MKLLYVSACPRGRGVSRTLRLADAFLAGIAERLPRAEIIAHDLSEMQLLPVDGPALAAREALIDARAFSDDLFAPARAFAAADLVMVAAPYWDLMFPSALKVYVEHVFIRELTFCYRDDQPVGLCAAKGAAFLTTAGSPIGANDFGAAYLRATFGMLGIERFASVAAEGLDIAGADTCAILRDAEARARTLASRVLGWCAQT